MNRWKSTLPCTYCSKIFKDPIELPCNHNLCKGHLAEKNIVKQNGIKCAECKQDFEIKDNDFKINNLVKNLLDEHVYLSDDEVSLKKQIEDSIRKLHQLYEQFTLNKTNRDLAIHEHFQEIRRNIDLHREELKVKIDDIYMEMIEKTKKFEATYLISLEEKLNASLKSFEIKSLEQSLNETEETFRNPNLLIESIRDMQRLQEAAIAELKLKLDEQNRLNDELTRTRMNQFKPNLSFSPDSFGQLHLNEYSRNDLFKSKILSGQQSIDLIKLCEFSLKDKWTLLYRGTRDGFGAANFHSNCNCYSITLTIVKAKGSSYIFGGFASSNWGNLRWDPFNTDPNAFLFSLTNKDNQPRKMKQISNTNESIICRSNYGPTFGAGHDLHICSYANTTPGSYSYLGNSYQHPQPSQGVSYLAGSPKFQVSEIEVYTK
jgi:hypothetical protein